MTDQPATEAGRAMLRGIETIAGATNLIANEVLDIPATRELVVNIEQEAAATERRRVVERIRTAHRLTCSYCYDKPTMPCETRRILDEVTTP